MEFSRTWPCALAMIAFLFGTAPAGAVTPPPAPELVVVIAVDQFSAALFDQYRGRFTGGLKRLAEDGVVFPNGYQSHAATETCPGHSTILSGRHPAATGIVTNFWFDRASGTGIYCVSDPSQPVPHRDKQPRGPANLKVSTFGEWLKREYPQSRVFGVAGKDRAAIMMTGHQPDGVFWWDDENGFTTSVPAGTTADARLAPVSGFNKALFDRWRSRPPVWRLLDKRCAALEGPQSYGGLAIDHKVPPSGWTPSRGKSFIDDAAFQRWFHSSPGLDKVTIDLAGSLIDRFQLGRGKTPDLLAISLSATDYVGHRFGNQGPEMCDQIAHLDQLLGAFLAKITALNVPVMVVLTADHGSIDAAERVAERGIPAVRIDGEKLASDVNREVKARLGLSHDPLLSLGEQFYILDRDGDAMLRNRIRDAAVETLRKRPEIEAVFTADELAKVPSARGKPVDELTLAERFAESFDAERSGDIFVAFKPFASFGNPGKYGAIAGHGSPWQYDRRVPILFWWPRADGFEQSLPVETVDIAPTLAGLIGVRTPQVDGRCLDLDRTAKDSCRPAPLQK